MLNKMASNNNRLFTQVTRTKTTVSGLVASENAVFDPLSMFASVKPKEIPVQKDSHLKPYDELLGNSSRANEHRSRSSENPSSDVNRGRTQSAGDSSDRGRGFFTGAKSSSDSIEKSSSSQAEYSKNPMLSEKPTRIDTTVVENTGTAEGNSNGDSKLPDEDSEVKIKFLTGEYRLLSIIDAFIQVGPGKTISGILYMTNYRVAFIPSPADLISIAESNPSIYSWLHIPLACIDRMEKERRDKQSTAGINLVISCKDFRQHRVTIRSRSSHVNSESELDQALGVISTYAFPNNMRYLFAFSHIFPLTAEGKKLLKQKHNSPFDLQGEFQRMGLLDSPMWRLTMANEEYKLCNTYPKYLYVPRSISDEDLYAIGILGNEYTITNYID